MADSQDEKFKAYEQLCNSYRAIDDFRAKLLGFLPLATGTGIFLLSDNLDVFLSGNLRNQDLASQMQSFLVAAGAFGFFITLGLFFYEIYGIKKCSALIRAGQEMEDSLHLGGQFKERPQNVARLINEPFAAGVIYPTVLAAWTFLALASAWPEAKPWTLAIIPICVFIVGFLWTLIYDLLLRKEANLVRTGSVALDFTLPSRSGRMVSLEEFRGKKPVVLFFYPKDESWSGTRETRAFRDDFEEFRKLDAEVIGISSDSVEDHKSFAAKHNLRFTLLSDEGGKVRKLYGIPNTFRLFPRRVTYILDKEGFVRHVFSSRIAVTKHVEEALKSLIIIKSQSGA